MEVSFNVTVQQQRIIRIIAARAVAEIFGPAGLAAEQDAQSVEMDLCAVIAQGQPLNLPGLMSVSSRADFHHDILGIWRYLNRTTGKLDHGWLPKCAAKPPLPTALEILRVLYDEIDRDVRMNPNLAKIMGTAAEVLK